MISIQFNNRQVLHGVVLCFGDRRVRVAVKGWDDAAEFRLVNQVWVSEDCEVVTFGAVERIAPVGTDEGDPFETLLRLDVEPEAVPRVM